MWIEFENLIIDWEKVHYETRNDIKLLILIILMIGVATWL